MNGEKFVSLVLRVCKDLSGSVGVQVYIQEYDSNSTSYRADHLEILRRSKKEWARQTTADSRTPSTLPLHH